MKRITPRQQAINNLHKGVVSLYKSGKYTTEQIATNYSISTRQVQRIATKYGVIRTLSESNKLVAPLKNYKTIPKEFKVVRKQISSKTRYNTIANQPWCTICGMSAKDGVRLEVDHIDNDPSNNNSDNLQVLCALCNTGKSHLDRFGL